MGTMPLVDPPTRSRFRSTLAIFTLRAPFWKRSLKHRWGRMLVVFAYGYLGLLGMLLFMENWLIFQASTASDSWSPPPSQCAVEDVWLTSADGTAIHCWWLKGPDWQPGQGAMLFFHGNGGNLSHRGDCARYWVEKQHLAVLLVDYPGYGKSGGKASEAGCYAAADAAYDWLTDEQKVPAERLLLYGGSLGGAVAVDLASRRPHRALLLISTFTTLPDMAQEVYPFLPARWLVRTKFDSLAKIGSVHRPVFMAHSEADTLIPCAMGRRLFEAANEPKAFITLHNLSHDDGGCPDTFVTEFAEFLNKHAP